jgi:dihydroflavonol-4-reductase
MRVLVTGGTGLLGNNILRLLGQYGHQTRSLVRGDVPERVFSGIETEFCPGDVTDADAVARAVAGCDCVIHSAAVIQLGWSRRDESMRVNRDGTKAIVQACIRSGSTLINVGTVNTLAVGSKTHPGDESTPLDHAGGQIPSSYVVSKRAAAEEFRRGITAGLRGVQVHPGFMLGPWDWKPSSGRMVLEVGRCWRPFAPTGGCSVCDARDVADGVIRAMEAVCAGKVENGREYVLAGYNQRYADLWAALAHRMGNRGPIMRAGPAMRWIGALGGDVIYKIRGSEPDLNTAAMRMSCQYHWHDSSRARREIGYTNRPYDTTLDEAAEWLTQHHLQAADPRSNNHRSALA